MNNSLDHMTGYPINYPPVIPYPMNAEYNNGHQHLINSINHDFGGLVLGDFSAPQLAVKPRCESSPPVSGTRFPAFSLHVFVTLPMPCLYDPIPIPSPNLPLRLPCLPPFGPCAPSRLKNRSPYYHPSFVRSLKGTPPPLPQPLLHHFLSSPAAHSVVCRVNWRLPCSAS